MSEPTPMPVPVVLADGARAEAVGLQENTLTIVSPKAFAPGQPLHFTIALGRAETQIQGKTIGCRRKANQVFEVRLRLVNLQRQQKQLLVGLLR